MPELSRFLKADIAELLAGAGFQVSDFMPQYPEDVTGIILNHKSGEGRISIFYTEDHLTLSYWEVLLFPGRTGHREVSMHREWSEVKNCLSEWLIFYNLELKISDPWAEFSNEPTPNYAIPSDTENTNFTSTEFDQLQAGINELRNLFAQHKRESTQALDEINRQMDYIIASGEKFGRKDWFNLAVGAIMNVATSTALPPEVVRQGWELLKDGVGGIIHLAPAIIDTAKHSLR